MKIKKKIITFSSYKKKKIFSLNEKKRTEKVAKKKIRIFQRIFQKKKKKKIGEKNKKKNNYFRMEVIDLTHREWCPNYATAVDACSCKAEGEGLTDEEDAPRCPVCGQKAGWCGCSGSY